MNISFVLPCYKRANLLRQVLPLNEVYECPDVEVILVLDEPSEEKAILEIVKAHRQINFRVIVNDKEHDWRPPSVPINVGIRRALAAHVAIVSPETAIVLPRRDYLQSLLADDYRAAYVGLCWPVPDMPAGEKLRDSKTRMIATEATQPALAWGFGFRLYPKESLSKLCGLNESLTGYGGDDFDIAMRISRLGVKTIVDGNIKLFTLWHTAPRSAHGSREMPSTNVVIEGQRHSWGTEFSRCAWDWTRA